MITVSVTEIVKDRRWPLPLWFPGNWSRERRKTLAKQITPGQTHGLIGMTLTRKRAIELEWHDYKSDPSARETLKSEDG